MKSQWILLNLIMIQTGSNYTVDHKIDVETSEMGWFEARKRCFEERGTDMFNPSERSLLDRSDVLNNTFYWVGGFETSQWRWTDNSPLFTNIGLCDVPTDIDVNVVEVLPYNSLLECYRKCNKYTIGLFGSSCFCLDENDHLACSKESSNITMCFGNPIDECGNDSSMSVYKVDVPFNIGNADYQCACFTIPLFDVRPYDCDESLPSICVDEANKNIFRCYNGLCVLTRASSWMSSNQSCTLAIFSRQNDFIKLDHLWHYFFGSSFLWIGLHKQRSRHWIDGKTVQLDFGNSDQDLRCLALMTTDGEWSQHWIPCSESHQSLCSSGEHSATTIPSVSETLGTTTETLSSTGKDNEIPGTSLLTTEERQIGEEHASSGNGNGKIGIYVGVSVGCLLVLAVIGFIVMFKRKGVLFFKRREGVKHIKRENIAYICPNNPENQDALHRSRQRGFGDLTTDQNETCGDKSNEINLYYNIARAVPKGSVDTGNLKSDFGGDRENYDIVNRIDNVDENTYEYIKPHDETQNVMVDHVQHHTCNQTGDNVVKVDIGLSGQIVKTYNHLKVSGSDKGALDASQCNNHLIADAESDYDATHPPVVGNTKNQIYANTSPVGEAQGTVFEVIMPMKDRTAETLSDLSDYYNL